MIKRVSIIFTEYLLSRGIIEIDRREIYVYGCELIFSTAVSALTVLLVGVLMNCFLATIVFLLYFMPIRTVGSGYHAKSHLTCYWLFLLVSVLCIGISYNLPFNFIVALVMIFLFMVAHLLIYLHAPYRSRKNKLKDSLFERNKYYMHCIQLIEIAGAGFLCYGPIYEPEVPEKLQEK